MLFIIAAGVALVVLIGIGKRPEPSPEMLAEAAARSEEAAQRAREAAERSLLSSPPVTKLAADSLVDAAFSEAQRLHQYVTQRRGFSDPHSAMGWIYACLVVGMARKQFVQFGTVYEGLWGQAGETFADWAVALDEDDPDGEGLDPDDVVGDFEFVCQSADDFWDRFMTEIQKAGDADAVIPALRAAGLGDSADFGLLRFVTFDAANVVVLGGGVLETVDPLGGFFPEYVGGDSLEDAIDVSGAGSPVGEVYRILRDRWPGHALISQALCAGPDDGRYDVMTIALAGGGERKVFFKVS